MWQTGDCRKELQGTYLPPLLSRQKPVTVVKAWDVGKSFFLPPQTIGLQMAEEAPSVKMQTPPSPGTNFNKRGHGKYLLRTVKHTQQPVWHLGQKLSPWETPQDLVLSPIFGTVIKEKNETSQAPGVKTDTVNTEHRWRRKGQEMGHAFSVNTVLP